MATDRKPSSTEWDRSRVMPSIRMPRLRYCRQAMKTTSAQPTPIRSRLEPVMLARARAQGESSPAIRAATDWQAG